MTTEQQLKDILSNYIELEYDDVLLAMKRAYNLAIEDSAENVKLKQKGKFVANTGYSSFKSKEVIDKKSILKLKIK